MITYKHDKYSKTIDVFINNYLLACIYIEEDSVVIDDVKNNMAFEELLMSIDVDYEEVLTMVNSLPMSITNIDISSCINLNEHIDKASNAVIVCLPNYISYEEKDGYLLFSINSEFVSKYLNNKCITTDFVISYIKVYDDLTIGLCSCKDDEKIINKGLTIEEVVLLVSVR